ncbi:MAG: PIG-L family deacetylase [Acidimicrobiales bacterium]|jgi:LmbE family N-acetylglucosaminyl deacetylase|nr:PIG-L family deacetylase [Acidimicrobiales bacterium]
MATIVCFHAHPDDEAIATGGSMILAADAGHDVVLVLGTRGEHGEPVPGVLAEGEELWQRRVAETHEAADRLGVGRVEFLGYRDSGMMGEPTNDDPTCFWQADVEEASDRLASLLREVAADVLTVYDDHGGYGHPDHIQVHRVGVRAAEKAGVERVFQSTMNRDHIRRSMEARSEEFGRDLVDAAEGPTAGEEMAGGLTAQETDRMRRATEEEFGSPEALITHAVDVTSVIDRKRDAMRAHESQIAPDSFFLAMPDEVFTEAFGTEWYIALGATREAGEPFAPSIVP